MSSTHEPRTERTETRNAAPRQLRYGGVLLAAGESRRMGGPNKLEMKLDGVALVRRTAQTLLAAGIAPLIVVLGHAAERIAPLLDGLPVRCVVNADYRDGQQSSVSSGLRALADPVDAYVVCLSDLPLMSAAQLRELFDAFERHPDTAILVPMHEGQRGNPVVFDAGLRDALLATPGGARAWIDAHPGAVRRHPVGHPGFTTDLDTLDDVAALGRLPDAPRVELP
ncbi:MAG: nucleotidyltransferase family protein [Burkholderiaceae bacterium]|nr:nucleotidyltransferase family protein [Burkholderiaceae bacterium]